MRRLSKAVLIAQIVIAGISFWALLVVGFPAPTINRHATLGYVEVVLPIASWAIYRPLQRGYGIFCGVTLVTYAILLWVDLAT